MHIFTLQINLLSEHKAAIIHFFKINLLCQGGNKRNKTNIIFQWTSHKLSVEVKFFFSKAVNTPAAPPVSEQGQMGRAVHRCLMLHLCPSRRGGCSGCLFCSCVIMAPTVQNPEREQGPRFSTGTASGSFPSNL